MNFKKYFLSAMMIAAFAVTATAGAGKEAILTAKSESGKVKLTVKTWDVDGAVSKAELTTADGTFDLLADYDIYSISDLPNHILTLFFQKKGIPADESGTGSLKVWAIPSSFVKTAGASEFNWRFKLRIGGTLIQDVTKMDGTFEWNP